MDSNWILLSRKRTPSFGPVLIWPDFSLPASTVLRRLPMKAYFARSLRIWNLWFGEQCAFPTNNLDSRNMYASTTLGIHCLCMYLGRYYMLFDVNSVTGFPIPAVAGF